MNTNSLEPYKQSNKSALEGVYTFKRITDSSLVQTPVARLMAEEPKTNGSMIPTGPKYDYSEQKLNFNTTRGNSSSKIATTRSTETRLTLSRSITGVVATEEEGNGYGWQQSDLNIKQETPTSSVSRRPPLRRKSDSTTSQFGKESGQRTKTSSGVGNSPRVTILNQTDSVNYQTRLCNDALAAAIAQQGSYSHSNNTFSTNSDEDNFQTEDMVCSLRAQSDDVPRLEVQKIEERNGKIVPTPHSSPAPSSIQGQSTAESCCSVYTNATIKNRSKRLSQGTVSENTLMSIRGVEASRDVDNTENSRSAFLSSGYCAQSVLESDLEPVALAEDIHITQVWQNEPLDELDNSLDSNKEFHSDVDSVNIETLFDTLSNKNPTTPLAPPSGRRKQRKHSDKSYEKKREESLKDTTNYGEKSKCDAKEVMSTPVSNIVPLASRLGYIATRTTSSLATSRNQSTSPERDLLTKQQQSHYGASTPSTKSEKKAFTREKPKLNNGGHNEGKSQREFTAPGIHGRNENAKWSSLRGKNVKKSKLIQEQSEKCKQDKNKQKKKEASRNRTEIESCGAQSAISPEPITKERSLLYCANSKHKDNEESHLTNALENHLVPTNKHIPTKDTSRLPCIHRTRSTALDGLAQVTENKSKHLLRYSNLHFALVQGVKTRELPSQEWSKDGVDVFGRKFVFWSIVLWTILWSFIKYCTVPKVFFGSMTKPPKQLSTQSPPQCDPLSPLLSTGSIPWGLHPVELNQGWCPSIPETVFRLNKCPIVKPYHKSQVPSPLQPAVASPGTLTGFFTFIVLAICAIFVLGWYWLNSTPVHVNRGDRSRQKRGRSRSRSVNRRRTANRVTFESPVVSRSITTFLKASLTIAAETASGLQDLLFQRDSSVRSEPRSREQSYRAESVETDVWLASRHSPSPAPRTQADWIQNREFTKSPSPAPRFHSRSPSRGRFDEERASMGAISEVESVHSVQRGDPPVQTIFSPIRTRSSTRRNTQI
eukprot:g8799.t1